MPSPTALRRLGFDVVAVKGPKVGRAAPVVRGWRAVYQPRGRKRNEGLQPLMVGLAPSDEHAWRWVRAHLWAAALVDAPEMKRRQSALSVWLAIGRDAVVDLEAWAKGQQDFCPMADSPSNDSRYGGSS